MSMRVADYIMDCLSAENVQHVFQVTGRGSLFLSDALAKHAKIKSVSLHHEQACAFAAIGYAESTQRIGACLVSTGCASTNAITGVLSAWQDGVPCIFISGQNILNETSRFTQIPLRTFGQQEADIVSLVGPITKYARMITKPEQIVDVMQSAIYHATNGRKGPVWIDIPLDLQSAIIEPEKINNINKNKETICEISDNDITSLINKLTEAKRPVVLIGRGIRSAGADKKFQVFIESWNLPVTYSATAPDIYGSANELSIGSVGAMGCSRAGNFAVANADLVLVLGSRLTSLVTGPDFCKFARAAKIIVVDLDPLEHSKKTIRIDHFIQCDLNQLFEKIERVKPCLAENGWIKKCKHWKHQFGKIETGFQSSEKIDLYNLSDVLSEILPQPSTIVTDSGLIELILPTNIRFSGGINCIHPASQGAMGFALPASIGAAFGVEHAIVTIVGDGSIMMNLQELESIRYNKIPIKIIVINNNVYAIIRHRQHDLFRKRTIGTDPSNGVSCPDFKKVAKCFGFNYSRINKPLHLKRELRNFFSKDGPSICEIMGREDQKYIELGRARSSLDNRFVRRPLEDQSPFLNRELFLSEMVIDPIDQ